MPHKKLKIKQDVLGKMVKPKTTGGFVVTPDQINNPLFYEGTVVRCFCVGCGYSTELSDGGAKKLAKIATVKHPINWNSYYFETKGCIVCSGAYQDPVLKKI